MISLLLKTLCLSFFIPLCLKAQSHSFTTTPPDCQSGDADCFMIAFERGYLKLENIRAPSPTVTASTLSCQSDETDCFMIAFERGALKLEDVREITFDLLLSDERDRVHFVERQAATYYESTTCGSRIVTVTTSGRKHITYNIVSPDGLCLNFRSSSGTELSPLSEAIVMLVSGSSIESNNWYSNTELKITHISFGGAYSLNNVSGKTNDAVDTETGPVSDNWHHQTAVYPNPATSFLTLTTPTANGMVNIFNTNGQLVYQDEIDNYTQNIVTHNWQSGLYFVQIIDLYTQAIEQHKLNIIR